MEQMTKEIAVTVTQSSSIWQWIGGVSGAVLAGLILMWARRRK